MKLLFVENSFLKQSTEQSSTVKPELLIAKSRNQVIDVSSVKQATEGHLEIVSEGKRYFCYDPHVEIYGDDNKIISSYNVLDDRSPQVDTDKIPDNAKKPTLNVKTVKVPHLGTIAVNEPIFKGSSFTWFEATHSFTRMPESKQIVNNIELLAKRLQPYRDRIGKPFHVTSFYRPTAINRAVGGASRSSHVLGLACDFKVEGFNAHQLYNLFDPVWVGGLGKYRRLNDVIHLDARGQNYRWYN